MLGDEVFADKFFSDVGMAVEKWFSSRECAFVENLMNAVKAYDWDEWCLLLKSTKSSCVFPPVIVSHALRHGKAQLESGGGQQIVTSKTHAKPKPKLNAETITKKLDEVEEKLSKMDLHKKDYEQKEVPVMDFKTGNAEAENRGIDFDTGSSDDDYGHTDKKPAPAPDAGDSDDENTAHAFY